MAVRRPLILTGDNDLIEMTDAQIDAVKDRCRYLYGANPSVTLSRKSTNDGNLTAMNDSRLQAGASTTNVSGFQDANNTPNVSTVNVTYDYLNQSTVNTTASVDTNNIAFPIYYNGSNIQSMSLTDMYDTFIFPAIDTILSAVGQPGTYRIHTSTSLSGYTAVSTDVIFRDTRANASAYGAGSIPETQDQPTTITDFYLLAANNISAPSMEEMLFVRNSDKNLQEYSQTAIDAILQNCMRHVASEESGSKIRYRINGSGTILGSAMTDTKLNSSVYRQRFVNQNDYRTQEFPAGSATTIATYYLKMYED